MLYTTTMSLKKLTNTVQNTLSSAKEQTKKFMTILTTSAALSGALSSCNNVNPQEITISADGKEVSADFLFIHSRGGNVEPERWVFNTRIINQGENYKIIIDGEIDQIFEGDLNTTIQQAEDFLNEQAELYTKSENVQERVSAKLAKMKATSEELETWAPIYNIKAK